LAAGALLVAIVTGGGLWFARKAYLKIAGIDAKLTQTIDSIGSGHEHTRFRLAVIRSHIAQIDEEFVAILGDSITERALAKSLCGKFLLNAGVGGATVGSVLRDILPLFAPKKPRAMLIAVGVNDASRVSPEPRDRRIAVFTEEYRRLLEGAKALTPNLAVALIGPVEVRRDLGELYYDPDLIVTFNGIIEKAAAEANVPVVSLAALADERGYAREGMTVDGVHLSAQGYDIWRERLYEGWSTAVKCEVLQ
jgi:lysophospholipase L1-like esterase